MVHPIISVHVPKTAGASFTTWLRTAFPRRPLTRDYADRPLDPLSPMNADPAQFLARDYPLAEDAIVHGHFWLGKYDALEPATRLTFLREPIARTISHYAFWKRARPHGNSLHDRFLAEQMTLLEFACLPQITRLYTGVFFRDVDMSRFAFIGNANAYEAELGRLEAMLGVKGVRSLENNNTAEGYQADLLELPSTRASLTDALRDDIALYEKYAGT